MKHIITLAALVFLSLNSFAAQVKKAKLDALKKYILIDVEYSGGCAKHEFSFQLKGCVDTDTLQCTAELVHTTNDQCESLKYETVVIPLSEYGLNENNYRNATLTILGDISMEHWRTMTPSQAKVFLP
jgi:hypothetical protein